MSSFRTYIKIKIKAGERHNRHHALNKNVGKSQEENHVLLSMSGDSQKYRLHN
jgi:hypothetical protein